MFDMIPFSNGRGYTAENIWDPFQEFFGTVVHSAATDIRERDDAFVIETELPGYDKSEIDVSLKEGVLRVHAERKDKEEGSDKGYIRRERVARTVERSFEVSGIDPSGIEARYESGVLTLTLPKLPETVPQQHQIEIK